MRIFFSVMIVGIAVLFPVLVGAISLDKSNYVANEMLFIPSIVGSGARFYNLTVPDFVVTVSGWSNMEMYELPVDFLIPGEYVLVDTNDPDLCSTLTLDECRANPDHIGETAFSVQQPSSQPPAQSPAEGGSFLGGLGELLGF